MKKYKTLPLLVMVTLFIAGCTSGKTGDKNVSNKTTTYAEGTGYFNKNNEDVTKTLQLSFKEVTDLKKTDIEEARDFQTSLKNGSVIMFSKKDGKELEVYNISMMDKFIDSFNSGKEGYVRIIKGSLQDDGKFLVNKLEEYETDGKIIKDTGYDTYSDKNKFIPGQSMYFPKIAKTSSDNGVRYAILESKDTPVDMGTTVISFDKSSVKN
ncbi:DUF4362 domain-containing protein [Clostridium sp. 19966]|uniref:hypothetical protein n=1 Tax=Clostridium sp. 19966 TaxID=2768166 RepID=UPI0028DF9164|nr:hypothetical protein [Clostridium sp. 19966]MDT8715360.1 DUF4362 domain-containing protein [Clostridium sp. 19966]